jgi:hypothetical protein
MIRKKILEGIMAIPRVAKEVGAAGKDYVSQRYIPNAMRHTRTDEGIDFLKASDESMTKALGGTADELTNLTNKKIAQGQKIIDDMQAADPRVTSIGNPSATRQQFEKIEAELRDMERLTAHLKYAARTAETQQEARQIMDQAYKMEKFASLIKGALVSLGAGALGMYHGARSEDANPDFYNPERGAFGAPTPRATPINPPDMGGGVGKGPAYNAVMEAVNKMDNKVNGRK